MNDNVEKRGRGRPKTIESDIILPSSPEDQNTIRKVVEDTVLLLHKIELVKQDIKDNLESLSETFELPVGFLNKIVKTRYKENYAILSKDVEVFEQSYETLFPEDAE